MATCNILARLAPRAHALSALCLLACCAGLLHAQTLTPAQPTRVNGIVSSITGSSFAIVDRSGTETTYTTSSDTLFQLNRTKVTFDIAVKVGANVRCTIGPDNKALQVQSRGMATRLNINQLKPLLQATDDDWKVLQPQIEKVQALQRELQDNGNGNNAANDPVAAALLSLREAYFLQQGTTADLETRLTLLRKARADAQTQLADARKDLTALLTVRQESLLVMMGILN